MDKKKVHTGGVALFNGIIFSSDYRQVIAQRNNKNIRCQTSEFNSSKNIINSIPIIRGILGISSQLNNAAPTFMDSSGEDDSKSNKKIMYFYLIICIICITIPIIVSAFFKSNLRNIVQISIILFEFLIYLIAMKFAKELDILFMYHGAEHKAVNAYEKLGEEGLTVENIKKSSRFHKRCGGNFVVYFIILTILSVFIPIDNLILKDIAMILLTILNMGIAYEIVNIFSILPKPFDVINYPATLIQLVTTKEPTDDMMEVAMYGIIASIREKNGIEINKYITNYIHKNLSNREYEVQDIYAILEYVTKVDRNMIFLNKDTMLLRINQEIESNRLLNKYYNEKYPLQYITHKQYFYKEKYYVDENVLIPRQDTEVLVEKAIRYIENEKLTKIIDLCTGSGAIGISIIKNVNVDNASVELIDISKGALNVAKRNVTTNGVYEKVKILESDLLKKKIENITNKEKELKYIDNIENRETQIEELKADMIISNPPYIKTDVIPTLQEEVTKEPHLALDGGKDGLNIYRRIIKEAKEVLKINGLLILEIGYDQLKDIEKIISENKEYKILEKIKDYGGNDRGIICRFQGK